MDIRVDIIKDTGLTRHSIRLLHSFYLLVYQARQADPETWTFQHCNRVLTSVMGGHHFSWRVTGITPKALKQFQDDGFKYNARSGITRAHAIPRIETVKELLGYPKPLSATQFMKKWLESDTTVLCAKGENRKMLPKHFKFPRSSAALFTSNTVGWRHGKKEIEFLQRMAARHLGSSG